MLYRQVILRVLMRLFLDSSDPDSLQEACVTGLISGITTNPTLIQKHHESMSSAIKILCEKIPDLPISFQVKSTTTEAMVYEGVSFHEVQPERVVVKIPLTTDGLKACKILRKKNIPVNVTVCFSVQQVLLAALADASYISVYMGRVEDTGYDSEIILKESSHLLRTHETFKHIQLLAASIRSPEHVLKALRSHVHIATLPIDVFWKLYEHPLTKLALTRFEKDSNALA
jgi:transaldolase